jgi:hypothetical protein
MTQGTLYATHGERRWSVTCRIHTIDGVALGSIEFERGAVINPDTDAPSYLCAGARWWMVLLKRETETVYGLHASIAIEEPNWSTPSVDSRHAG